MEFGEEPVLDGLRRHVVEHREGRGGGESVRRQARVRRIGVDDLDVRACKTRREGSGELGIDLDRCQARHPLAEEVRREPRARTDFEDIVAQAGHRLEPGQQVFSQHLRPLGTGEEFAVSPVHKHPIFAVARHSARVSARITTVGDGSMADGDDAHGVAAGELIDRPVAPNPQRPEPA